jgi:hypothetical protein
MGYNLAVNADSLKELECGEFGGSHGAETNRPFDLRKSKSRHSESQSGRSSVKEARKSKRLIAFGPPWTIRTTTNEYSAAETLPNFLVIKSVVALHFTTTEVRIWAINGQTTVYGICTTR